MGASIPKPEGTLFVEREAAIIEPSSLLVSDTLLGRGCTGFVLAARYYDDDVAVKVWPVKRGLFPALFPSSRV
jgi:hypothetical protein